jgi:hypothetical protein
VSYKRPFVLKVGANSHIWGRFLYLAAILNYIGCPKKKLKVISRRVSIRLKQNKSFVTVAPPKHLFFHFLLPPTFIFWFLAQIHALYDAGDADDRSSARYARNVDICVVPNSTILYTVLHHLIEHL